VWDTGTWNVAVRGYFLYAFLFILKELGIFVFVWKFMRGLNWHLEFRDASSFFNHSDEVGHFILILMDLNFVSAFLLGNSLGWGSGFQSPVLTILIGVDVVVFV